MAARHSDIKPHFAALGALPALLLVAACGQEPASGGSTAPPSASPQRYEVEATVLEDTGHGPQLCHSVRTSLPPQCGGPDVVGWDWGAVKSESAQGTKWGSYLLRGTWDGTRFSLSEPAKPSGAKGKARPRSETPDYSPPCETPPDGWRAVDSSKARAEDYERALQLAEKDAEFAGGWIFPQPAAEGTGANRTVLVMRFTRDLPTHQREIRRIWGGPLCLTTARHSQAELRKVQEQLTKTVPGVLTAGSGSVRNAVDATVMVATDDIQRDVDRRFGAGVVHLEGWLKPVG